ncbi:hypothetical protein [Clostridium drakei]|uniref:Lipoprotein n=1 Tax=Clostridium drakei TaxID=332101 RepID=A0A2U8DKC2_9CLOT|nr:hypothetical protein [Clostridium drakei]AWI03147.1 hypothetical protein B9W14_01045 [Clostridium drakei]
MKSFLKKLTLVTICIAMFASLTGCYTAVKPDKDPKKLVQDVKRTNQIKKEKDLITGEVYIRDNRVTATMVFKDDISKEESKKLIDKYVEALKKEYKGMKINVQAVQKDKSIANINVNK